MNSDDEEAGSNVLKANEPHSRISKGIISSISKLMQSNNFQDFEVTVEGDTFACHSCILASCSEYFNSLLRSDLKEKKERKLHLNDISSPTFQLILKALYTGEDVLTINNVSDIWSAVHQLQIPFLIDHCEDFVINYLHFDNLERFKEQAEGLHSEKVCEYIFDFFLNNFDTLRETSIFLRLDSEYLHKLLQNDSLQVRSENDVLTSVLDWVNYKNSMKSDRTNGPPYLTSKGNSLSKKDKQNNFPTINEKEQGDRKQYLLQLIKSTRYLLATEEHLEKLYNDPLIESEASAKDILKQALTFKSSDYLHGDWPITAIHRDCSNVQHVGITCTEKDITCWSFREHKWFQAHNLPKTLNTKLIFFKEKLHACSMMSPRTEIYRLQGKQWVLVAKLQQPVYNFLALDNYMYFFDGNGKAMTRLDPDIPHLKLEAFTYGFEYPCYALVDFGNIVVFGYESNNEDEQETAVHSWNTKTQKWKKLKNIKFSSEKMTSFHGGLNSYILDSNGTLMKLTTTKGISFTFVAKLWRKKYNLQGAVVFKEILHIFYSDRYYPYTKDIPLTDKVDGVFSSAILKSAPERSSNFVHYALNMNELDIKKSIYD